MIHLNKSLGLYYKNTSYQYIRCIKIENKIKGNYYTFKAFMPNKYNFNFTLSGKVVSTFYNSQSNFIKLPYNFNITIF